MCDCGEICSLLFLVIFVWRFYGVEFSVLTRIISDQRSFKIIGQFSRPLDFRKKYGTLLCRAYGLKAVGHKSGVDTLVPKKMGRFGNLVLEFVHGVFICYIFGWNRISAAGLAPVFLKPFNTTDGIEVVPKLNSQYRAVELDTFALEGSPECPLDDVGIASTFRAEAWKWLPVVNVNESRLYMHTR
jgi:hypothetical protein